jgi:hypothetical protein|tara:strand:- start:145 stop:633 length:489 start_codon:yes stop_codon:yes gene_type:complete
MSGYTPPAVDLTATDAAIATVDTVVDGIVTDVAALRDKPSAVASGELNSSMSSSAAYADTGMTLTMPSTAGKTYTVYVHTPSWTIDDIGNVIGYRIDGDTLGAGVTAYIGPAVVGSERYNPFTYSWGPFDPSEVVHVEWISNVNTKAVRLYGAWTMEAVEVP